MAKSHLFGLARQVSEYIRRRYGSAYRKADEAAGRQRGGSDDGYKRTRDILFGSDEPRPPGDDDADQQDGAPPVDLRKIWPGAPGAPRYGDDDGGPGEEFDDVQLLGRDAGYHQGDFDAVMESMRETPGSSNVYGYFFERESRTHGILYVTFLASYRGEVRAGTGPTYAYYGVSVKKANDFQKASAGSAGGAVWDYLRIRGTVAGHQHQYRLVHTSGNYVPRKVTPVGFRDRAVPDIGVGRRSYKRNTLPATTFGRGDPDRGGPDRGEPDRGN